MNNDLVKYLLSFSALFMFIGGMFVWHSYKTYEAAREIMETLTDLVLKHEGTD